MYVKSLSIKNLRSFESAEVQFNVPGSEDGGELSNVNLLLGDNGAGKTSVLRAVALAALAPLISSNSGFVPFSLARRVGKTAVGEAHVGCILELHSQDGASGTETSGLDIKPTTGFHDRISPTESKPWAESMWDDKFPGFFLVGYGATRRVDANGIAGDDSGSKSRMLRYARVAGLFEDGVTLKPLSPWLPRLRQSRPELHDQVVALLNQLLEPDARVLAEAGTEEQYLFDIGGSSLPFDALSDGYRAFIGWVADLLFHLAGGRASLSTSLSSPAWVEPLVESRGVVLVDEVDLHLHPEWQQRVIPSVSRAFPNIQFVLTSHSPLVVGSLWRPNVFVLEPEEAKGVHQTRLRVSQEEVFGRSADQILTSESFGLASPRNPEFQDSLVEAAQDAQEGDPEAAMEFMRMMALGGDAETESLKAVRRSK